jgi:hypothetical protein
VAEGERIEVQGGDAMDGAERLLPVGRDEAGRGEGTAGAGLQGIAADHDTALRQVQGDVAGGVAGGVGDAQAAEHGKLVAVIEKRVDLAAADEAHRGGQPGRDARVAKGRGQGGSATDGRRLDGMDTDARRDV